MTPTLVDFIHHYSEMDADPETVAQLLAENLEAHQDYEAMLQLMAEYTLPTMGGFVYMVPVIPPHVCDNLIECAKNYDFTPNLLEEPDYRINEAVLSVVAPVLYETLVGPLSKILNAYCLMINQTEITSIESLQLAKYRPDGTAETKWHHDDASDFTCVISLNPESFEGGGTGVRVAPHATQDIPPLQKGWGLVFNGRSVQHRGLQVTSGERLLLVCWCSTREKEE